LSIVEIPLKVMKTGIRFLKNQNNVDFWYDTKWQSLALSAENYEAFSAKCYA